MLRSYLQSFLFPVLMSAVIASVLIMKHNQVDPELWVAYTYSAATLLLLALEFVFPRDASWSYFHKGKFNFREAALDTGFYFYGEYLAKLFLIPIASWIVDQLKVVSDFPIALPFSTLTQIVLLVFTIDLMRYWLHRWQHEFGFLWRFHALHHSAPRLSAISATRTHPVDDLVLYLPETILVLMLGFDVQVVAGTYSVIWVLALVKHSNIDLQPGWMARFFQIPRYHLIHHQLQPASAKTYNYSEITIFWDYLFRTFKGTALAADHKVGVESSTKRSVFRELFGSFYLPIDKL